MRLRDAAKWIKEKITGKKTEETPVLTPMIATEEDIERAKKMDREIEEMEKKSALVAPIVTSQAEMERLQRFEERRVRHSVRSEMGGSTRNDSSGTGTANRMDGGAVGAEHH